MHYLLLFLLYVLAIFCSPAVSCSPLALALATSPSSYFTVNSNSYKVVTWQSVTQALRGLHALLQCSLLGSSIASVYPCIVQSLLKH
jgi:hypothetical protein